LFLKTGYILTQTESIFNLIWNDSVFNATIENACTALMKINGQFPGNWIFKN